MPADDPLADIRTTDDYGPMTKSIEITRWEPTTRMPELPLSAFNLAWSAMGRLTCEGLYSDVLNPPFKGVVVAFADVHAFMSFDEYADYLYDKDVSVPRLAKPALYGGCWPFVEVLASPWLTEVTDRDGTLEATSYRHWAILAMDQTLHVMAHKNSVPAFEGWLALET